MLLRNTLFISFVVVLLSSFSQEEGRTRHFLKSTVPLDMASLKQVAIFMEGDSIQDTLYQLRSKDNIPVAYYQPVTRSVCFDNKCRILKVNIYWNITGRYLGFEMPKGEFLSKTDHVPFELSDYRELNVKLSDSLSRLNEFSLGELAPKAYQGNINIDGLTSATSTDVADYVVKGAGYTTFAMWHIIYGEGRKKVMQLTEKELNPGLLLMILDSETDWDKYWALERLSAYPVLNPELEARILSLISADASSSLAVKALQSLRPVHLKQESLQRALLGKFNGGSYDLKNAIIGKLSEVPALNAEVGLALAQQLPVLNGELFIQVLALLKKHHNQDKAVANLVAELLNSSNRFIANKAFDFLKSSGVEDAQLKKRLEAYRDAN